MKTFKQNTKKEALNMRKYFYPEGHPHICKRKEDLDPTQPGLLRNSKKEIKCKKIGEANEHEKFIKLSEKFPSAKIYYNIYFETGYFNSKLNIYQTVQIDFILVFPNAVIVIEVKHLSDDVYTELSGSPRTKTWRLKTSTGKKRTFTNGCAQNYMHHQFLKQLLEYNSIDVPIHRITVLGGISEDKVKCTGYIDDNLILEDDLIEKINSLLKKNKAKIDVDKVCNTIDSWTCTTEGREILHIVLIKCCKKNCLPKRCKGKLRKL